MAGQERVVTEAKKKEGRLWLQMMATFHLLSVVLLSIKVQGLT
jgi:hypothetical protein